MDSIHCVRCKEQLLKPGAYQDDDILVVCADCFDARKDVGLVRMKAYENLVQHMSVKCPYVKEGCTEMMLPKDLTDHTTACPFRTFQCKFCPWIGVFEELVKHYKSGHVFSNPERFCIGSGKVDHLFKINGSLFMLNVVRKKSLRYEMKYVGWNDRAFNWRLRVAGNWTESMLVYSYRNTTDRPYVAENVPFTTLFCCIEVIEDEIRSQIKLNVPIDKLYCPVCLDVFVPPIYQCVRGHSVCSSCCELQKCPLCRDRLHASRNTTLEQLVERLCFERKCPNSGCNHVSNVVHLRNHEPLCDFRKFECPVEGCTWKMPFYKLTKHLSSIHAETLLKPSTQRAISKNSPRKVLFFQSNNDNFRVTVDIVDWYMRVSVQYVGHFSKAFAHVYSIRLVTYDSGLVQSELCVTWQCKRLTPLDAVFADEESFVQLPVRNLGSDVTKARFKIKIDFAKNSTT